METAPESTPGYIDEVEALLQTNFFYDEARTSILYEGPHALPEEEIGSRKDIYIGALRVLAAARRNERAMAASVAASQDTSLDTKEWNQNWELTPKKLGSLAVQHRHHLVPLSRRISLINNAERALDEGYAQQGLYNHQIPYLQGVVEKIQLPAAPVILPEWWRGKQRLRLPGVTVTGPTGIGKSAILARTVMALGIDRPLMAFDGEHQNTSPAHVLVVEPSQALIRQMLGKTGKDTFRRLAPNVSVGGYFQYEQNTEANVIFISIKKFVDDFRDGYLQNTPIDAIFVDEDHHLTEKEFLTALLTNWNGPTFGFSATPTYSHKKDVRNILRHEVKEGDISDYTDGTILSNLQLYNFIVLPEDVGVKKEIRGLPAIERQELRRSALSQIAKDFLTPLLAEGRKGIIFCEPGFESAHARNTADLLHGLELPDGRLVVAEAIGTFQGKGASSENEAIIDKYNAGEVDIITTTLMGQEGLDFEEVNFVCVLGKVTSALKLTQMGGRGTRPSKTFDTTVLAQFNTYGFGQELYYTKTFAEILNGGQIDQGVVIQRVRGPGRPRGQKAPAAVPLEQVDARFSERIQSMLARIHHKNVQDVYIGQTDEKVITPGYIALEEIIAGKGIKPRQAWQRLYRAGYRFEGQKVRNDEQSTTRYYFEPTAQTYFSPKPEPPKDGVLQVKLRGWANTEEGYTLDELADALQVNKKVLVRDYLTPAENAQGPEARTNKGTSRGRLWLKEDGDKIIARLRNLLEFPPHLLTVAAAAKRLNAKYSTVLEHVRCYRTELGVKEVTRGRLKLPGLPWSAVAKLEEQYGLREGVEPIDHNRMPTTAADDEDLIAYARRIQRRYLPPSWLPRLDVERTVPARPDHEPAANVSTPAVPAPEPPTVTPPVPVPVEEKKPQPVMFLSPKPVVENRTTAPTLPEVKAAPPTTPAAPSVRSRRVTPAERSDDTGRQLPQQPRSPKPPEAKPPAEPLPVEREDIVVTTSAAAAKDMPLAEEPLRKITPDERRQMIAATRPIPPKKAPVTKRTGPKTTAPIAGRQIKQMKPSDMPRGYVDLEAYLADENAACSEPTMRGLIRQAKLAVAVSEEDGKLWGPDLTALELEEAIKKRYPLVEPGMSTPERIAALFAGTGIESKHVMHVASRVVSSLDLHVSLRRELQEDQTIWLDKFYSKHLTERVISRINELQGNGIRFRSLLRLGPV